MKHLIQRPRPDELLSSVWLRSRRRAGVGIGLVTKTITGRKFAPSFFSYAHVVDLAAALGVDQTKLLWDHSIFPYATAFVPKEVFAASLASALSTGHAAIGCGSTVQSVSDHVGFMRYCHACAREDLFHWGESYWHREHNLPGTFICLRHMQKLRQTHIATNQHSPWPDALPHELRAPAVTCPEIDAWTMAMARRSVALLNREMVAPVPWEPNEYREALLTKGLLSDDRPVKKELLASWARQELGSRHRHLEPEGKANSFKWLALMVRPLNTVPFVPLKHVLFETLLELAATPDGPVLDYTPTGLTARPSKPQDAAYAAAVRRVLADVRAQGSTVRVSDALSDAGCWGAYRHARDRFPQVQNLVRQLRESGQSARRVPSA